MDSSSTSLFKRYSDLLLKWNKTYNLTAVDDPKEIQIKHFEDSLAPLPFLPQPCRLLDIGCGAGFPGVPLKIVRTDLEVVLLDSIQKKTAFCENLIRELGLKNIQAVHGRAEDQTLIQKLGLFDVVISRATASLSDLLHWASPFIKEGGVMIAMKSRNWREEYKENPDWKIKEIFDYDLSQDLGKRSLIIFTPAPAVPKQS